MKATKTTTKNSIKLKEEKKSFNYLSIFFCQPKKERLQYYLFHEMRKERERKRNENKKKRKEKRKL